MWDVLIRSFTIKLTNKVTFITALNLARKYGVAPSSILTKTKTSVFKKGAKWNHPNARHKYGLQNTRIIVRSD